MILKVMQQNFWIKHILKVVLVLSIPINIFNLTKFYITSNATHSCWWNFDICCIQSYIMMQWYQIRFQKRLNNDVHCRCGVNGDAPACIDQQHYQTRCKCYKLKLPCGTTCKCKNCSNTFGKRSILWKRTCERHQYQITLPTSKQFIEAKSEKLAKGTEKSINQIRSKLQNYLNEMTAIDTCSHHSQ